MTFTTLFVVLTTTALFMMIVGSIMDRIRIELKGLAGGFRTAERPDMRRSGGVAATTRQRSTVS